ncbi:MAG: DUF262 domain-containing protein [Dehalococcoidia bacterium]
METSKKPWPLSTVYGIQDRIDTNPDYQRPAVWTRPQKQLLIDTILRNYDIPKLYWRRTGRRPDTYDVVDGQQRLRAIWDFFAGEFNLAKDADVIEDYEIAGLKYSELPDELRIRFDTYPLDVVLVEDTDEDEVREMFLSSFPNGASRDPQGLKLLAFREGRLVSVSWTLGSDWAGVPTTALIESHHPFGLPSREVAGDEYLAIWVADGLYRQLSCPAGQQWGEGCRISIGAGTLEQLEQELEILRRHP